MLGFSLLCIDSRMVCDAMKKGSLKTHPWLILRHAVETVCAHPIILLPFITIAFFQLLLLEILYFSPRQPLVHFFGPIITKFYGETHLHYPYNLLILPKLFSSKFIQMPFYFLIICFFISTGVNIIHNINKSRNINFFSAIQTTLPRLVHIVSAGIIMATFYFGLPRLYEIFFIERALAIRSVTGKFYILKQIVIEGAPYFHLFSDVLITTLFAFVLPIIVIENKKFYSAIWLSFKNLFQSFGSVFFIVFVSTLIYLPVLLLRNSIVSVTKTNPEVLVWTLVFSIVVMMLVDVLVYTSITNLFLIRKENRS